MARARNIKPAFFDNEDLAEIDPLSRLLFIGLWCLADREGRIELRPKRIKAQLFAYDECDINKMIGELSDYDFINIYSVDSKAYLQINKWAKHQNPHHKEIASILPAPENHKDTVCNGYIPMSNTIRNKTYEIHGRVCCCCGTTENLEIDHKMPISKGGNSVDENLQVLCKRCNVKKFDNYIDFSRLPKDKLSMVQAWFKHGSSITQEQFNEIASILTDSLLLIPDPLIPITDSTDDKSCRFAEFWDLYGKKTDSSKCKAKFSKLTSTEIVLIFTNLPLYIKSTPDKQYRKNPITWLNGKCWNDEIMQQVGQAQSVHTFEHQNYQSGKF